MARRKISASARRSRGQLLSKGFAKARSARYRETAKSLAKFVPELKPISRKSILSAQEKSRVTHFANVLKGVDHLVPVDAKTARKQKTKLYAKGVRAIQLKGVSNNAKLGIGGNDLLMTSNGKDWVFWAIDRPSIKSHMQRAAERAFLMQFPIEKLADLADVAFKELKVKQIHLWTERGIVGDGHKTIEQFIDWLNEKWQSGRYFRPTSEGGSSNPDRWINGIAIQLIPRTPMKETPHTAGRKVSEMG